MNSLNGVSDEVIEHARVLKGVGIDWACGWCQNDCGELVFYPPEAEQAAVDIGKPFLLVCSNACLREVMGRLR